MRFEKKNSQLKRLLVSLIVAAFVIMSIQTAYADVSLAPPTRYALNIDDQFYNIVNTDMNDDGNVDFVITSYRYLIIMIGDGEGGYVQTNYYTDDFMITNLAVSDMNGDGNSDIILSDMNNNRIRIHYGIGNGLINAFDTLSGVNRPLWTVANDFNKDGTLDLVVGSENGLNVLIGQTDGMRWTFSNITNYLAGNCINKPVVADFNSDGYDDIAAPVYVVGSSTDGGINIITNNNDGTFNITSAPYCTDVVGVSDIACEDFNGDGNKDIIVVDNYSNLRILNGTGSCGLIDSGFSYRLNLGMYEPIVADINNDGFVDIFGSVSDEYIGVIEGNGDGSFKMIQHYLVNPSSYPRSAICTDYDNDGALDIIALEQFNRNVVFFRNIMLDCIKNVEFSSIEQRVGTTNDVMITVSTQGVPDGSEIKASFINGDGTNLSPSIDDIQTVTSDCAVLTLHVPDSIALGNYKIKIEIPARNKVYESNYLVYDYGTIVWNTPNVIVSEGDGECSINFSRINGSKGDLNIDFSLSGTAILGVDYDKEGMFSDGIILTDGSDNNSVTLKFNILDDDAFEGDKTIAFTLNYAPANITMANGLPATAIITIKDDESNSLAKVITPSAITGIANGTAKNSASLGLPSQVVLETSIGNAMADVLWDVDASSYDPSSKLAQTFIVNGNVILPSYVTNPNNIDLNISIEVNVNEKIPGKITVSANSSIGGSTTGSGIYCEGDIVTVTATPNNGYNFVNWIENGTIVSTDASYTFVAGLEDRVLMANFNAVTPPNNSGGSGGGSGGSSIPSVATNKIIITTDAKTKLTKASTFADTVISSKGKDKAEAIISKKDFNMIEENEVDSLTVSSSIGSLSFDSDAIDTIYKESTENIKIIIEKSDLSTLSNEVKKIIGDRDIYSLSVISGSKTINEFKGNVTVSLPYTLREGEDVSSIVIYYINSEGKLEAITNSVYDAKIGMITFTTNHFSKFAIGYNKVEFTDVLENEWYYDAINFISARNITSGTEYGKFNPNRELTRAEFLVMVMRAYGILPDENLSVNFSDAGNTYYTGYIAVAKSLEITKGAGDNMFEPDKEITRQEMAVLLYNTLKAIDKLPKAIDKTELVAFTDSNLVEDWAKDAMTLFIKTRTINGSNNMLNPTKTATRAEMAQLLYNLLIK